MTIVYILIPVSLVLVGLGVFAFFWAVRAGQFDELDAAAWEILVDDRNESGPNSRQPSPAHPRSPE
ncbi:MAG: cbb3-type cytochrome oxidase assembly protein CcoS [Steroidobacteraceae bacterium]|jgi:cbb3-type cytochrome oxidase maturation protein